jgi:hypothetical protein
VLLLPIPVPYPLPIPVPHLLSLPAPSLLPSPVHGAATNAIDVHKSTVSTASLLPPATGPPCLLHPCLSFHLPFDRLHPLPPSLSALCTLPSVSAGGEGSFGYGEGLSICGLASCPSVSGEGLNLYAYCAEMSQVIHQLPGCQSCNSRYKLITKKRFQQSEHISPLHMCPKHQSLKCVIQGGVGFCTTQCASSFHAAWTWGGYCSTLHTLIVHLWTAVTLLSPSILVQLFDESLGSVLSWCTTWIQGGCCCTLLLHTLVTDIGHTRDWHTRV